MGDQVFIRSPRKTGVYSGEFLLLQWDFACSGRGAHEYKMKQYDVLAKLILPVLFMEIASYQGILGVTPGSVGVQLDKQRVDLD